MKDYEIYLFHQFAVEMRKLIKKITDNLKFQEISLPHLVSLKDHEHLGHIFN